MTETQTEQPETERYITRDELAEVLGISLRTIDRMINQGVPTFVIGDRSRRFELSKVLEWLRERERRGRA